VTKIPDTGAICFITRGSDGDCDKVVTGMSLRVCLQPLGARDNHGSMLRRARCAVVPALVLLTGCNSLLGGNYSIDPNWDADSAARCFDPAGNNGTGCYVSDDPTNCPLDTPSKLINACTNSKCLAINNPYADAGLGESGVQFAWSEAGFPADISPALSDAPPDSGVVDAPAADATTDVATDAADIASLPLCSSLSNGNVVYMIGSSAISSLFLGQIAQPFEQSYNGGTSPHTGPFTIVYQSAGSCDGVNAMIDPTNHPMTGTATYWDTSQNPSSASSQLTCALDPGVVRYADVGISDVFAATCMQDPTYVLPTTLLDQPGPIQTMTFSVPQSSLVSPTAISAQQAYLVFGFGGLIYPILPWIDPAYLQIRSTNSGTENMIAAEINVPPAKWWGVQNASSSGVDLALQTAGLTSTIATKTLGILATDVVEGDPSHVNELAYQSWQQNCAYFPNSVAGSNDKANVRDGHYVIWGPLHMIAPAALTTGIPTNAMVQRFFNVITGAENLYLDSTQTTTLDLIATFAKQHVIPMCAMHVQRSQDGGPIRPYTAPRSCDCYYQDRALGQQPQGCTQCSTNADCANVSGSPQCVHAGSTGTPGYCEPAGTQ
jgi:hypothetical protein